MIKKILLLPLFWVLLMPMMTFGADQSVIGSVIMVQGKVYAKDLANVTRTLQRRSEIYLNDTVITLAESKIQLRLKDDSIIVVQPSSKFTVDEFYFDSREPRRSRYVGNLVQGALVNISGQGKPENYQLKSPLAAITFRGTGFATKVYTKGNTPFKQDLEVFSGYVTVRSICDRRRIFAESCEPQQIDVGVGQKMMAVTIGISGRIQPNETGALLNTLRLGKIATRGTGGSVSINCRTNQ